MPTSSEINAMPQEERRAYFVARDRRFNSTPSKKKWREDNKERKQQAHQNLRTRDLEYYRAKNRVWGKLKRGLPLDHGKFDDTGFKARGKRTAARRLTHAEYQSERKKNDPHFRLTNNLRCRVYVALKKQYGKKAHKTRDVLGCTVQELRAYLEAQWKHGMSWDNYGANGWEIDHKRPCTAFDLTDPTQQQLCFHFTNLQPLWAHENRSKSNSIREVC